MSYKSPIELIMSDMQIRMEGEVCKAVQNVGVNVDKDELINALRYDRDQYQKGYDDMDSKVVRCKDCKNVCMCDTSEIFPDIPIYAKCTLTDKVHNPDWFCADGERKEGR